ncbi:tail fiber protein [Hymenobacter metallicola]|uniref:Tail fiber protein n=2 Tax=Hymenobacter metallicola TaxID=2563114 RepID=A0A4Z0QFB6_9BACT|nr:tail fiber protein [Hymenobacter metallicola]
MGTTLLGGSTYAVSSPVAKLAATPAAGIEPIGTVKLFVGPELPAGWVVCDGSLLRVDQHPALYKALGAMYGGNGQTTFALPKLLPTTTETQLSTWLPAVKIAAAPVVTALAELRMPHQTRRLS